MPDSKAARSKRKRSDPPPLAPDCALFLDIDGTLAEHAANADDVRIDAEFIRSLPRVADYLGGALALITGRSIASVDRLFPDVRMPIAGQHGSERRDAVGAIHLHVADPDTYARLRSRWPPSPPVTRASSWRTRAARWRCIIERFRDWPPTCTASCASIADSIGGGSFDLQPGKRTLELRPERQDKGTAIAEFMGEAPFLGRRPVFAGDDKADEYGFAVVDDAGGWSIKVGRGRCTRAIDCKNIADVRRWVMAPIVADDADLQPGTACTTSISH